MRKSVLVYFIILLLPIVLFSAETPELLWRYATGGRIVTAPVEGRNGTIYFGSEDRYVYAVLEDGTLKWRFNLGDRISDTLTIGSDGTIYSGVRKGFLIAINDHGKQIWKIKLNGEPFGSPSVDSDGTLFLVTSEGWLYSISHTGFIHWEVKLPVPPSLSPVSGNSIFVGLSNERIYSYDKNGKFEWVFLLSGQAESIALSENALFVGTDNSTLVAINFNGRKIWNRSYQSSVSSVIVLSSDRIMSAHGSVLSLLDSEGLSLWERKGRGTISDLAVISDTSVMINSSGTLFWTDMQGNPLGNIDGGVPGNRFLLSENGSVYVGSIDWLFYKYGFEGLVFSKYKDYLWPSFRNNSRNTALFNSNESGGTGGDINSSSDYRYLMILAQSSNEENLKTVLSDIESRIFSRPYDRGKIYFKSILEYIASEGIKHPLKQDGILINNFPVIRSKAVDLLGITGNLDTVEFLSDLLGYEWDSYVQYSIIKSLGYLRSDYNKEISDSLVEFYVKNRSAMDLQTMRQLLITVQKLFDYTGSIAGSLLDIILNILLDSSSKGVKELALDTIHIIQGQ